jgi:hypothetical protein
MTLMRKKPHFTLSALLFVCGAGSACAQFTDVTNSSGIATIIDDRYDAFPQWWLSGIHFLDLDADGDLDVFLSSHGGGAALAAVNNGQGRFTVAAGSYPSTEVHLSHDINEDGKLDLSMTYLDGGGQWWRNYSTSSVLDLRKTSITTDGNSARTQVFADVNRDGRADWIRAAPPGLRIDLGNGTGGFTMNGASVTIPGTGVNDNANVLPGDFDNDGDTDLLVMVGGGYDDTAGKTNYYRNDGPLQWTVQTSAAGLPADGTVAKGIGDYDLDGDLDFIAIENKRLPPVVYRNGGSGAFTRVANAVSGVSAGTLNYSTWGTAVTTDFDNDGTPDILMNGKYYLMLLRGTGGGNFAYMNSTWGITNACACSVDGGLAFGDIDGDGDLDIGGSANVNQPYYMKIYRNDNPARSWLRVRPVGLAGNRGATGARIRLYAAGTSQLIGHESVGVYCFQAAPSYYGKSMTERHFGLGSRTTVDVEVQFQPSGRTVRRQSLPANGIVEIREDADSIFENDFE